MIELEINCTGVQCQEINCKQIANGQQAQNSRKIKNSIKNQKRRVAYNLNQSFYKLQSCSHIIVQNIWEFAQILDELTGYRKSWHKFHIFVTFDQICLVSLVFYAIFNTFSAQNFQSENLDCATEFAFRKSHLNCFKTCYWKSSNRSI